MALIRLDQSASNRMVLARNESQVPKERTLLIVLHLFEERYSTPNAKQDVLMKFQTQKQNRAAER